MAIVTVEIDLATNVFALPDWYGCLLGCLRTLLILGAMSVLSATKTKTDPVSRWLCA